MPLVLPPFTLVDRTVFLYVPMEPERMPRILHAFGVRPSIVVFLTNYQLTLPGGERVECEVRLELPRSALTVPLSASDQHQWDG